MFLIWQCSVSFILEALEHPGTIKMLKFNLQLVTTSEETKNRCSDWIMFHEILTLEIVARSLQLVIVKQTKGQKDPNNLSKCPQNRSTKSQRGVLNFHRKRDGQTEKTSPMNTRKLCSRCGERLGCDATERAGLAGWGWLSDAAKGPSWIVGPKYLTCRALD